MDDLTAFLNARLDEDEAALRAVQDNSEPWRGEWAGDEANFALRTRNGWSLARAVTVEEGFPPGVLAHIARHDPARVLREVEAKRAILARYGSLPSVTNLGEHLQRSQEQAGLDYAIRLLAAIWSDHPDYRAEWKP